MPFPHVPKALLEALVRAFPPNPPDEYETLEELRVRAGEQKVINKLRQEYQEQNENILATEIR